MSRRRSRNRSQFERVLIVTEGSETEPTYFRDLCADPDYRLSTVDVDGSCDSNPLSVVDYGLMEFEDDGDYDHLYCVFDRDQHDGFEDAIRRLYRVQNDTGWNLHWTFSVPCFEYWILLHFTLTGRRFQPPGSPCSRVIDEVENHLPNYGKGIRGLYKKTNGKLDTAMDHARQRWSQAEKGYDSYSPRTKVHKLISHLQGLRS